MSIPLRPPPSKRPWIYSWWYVLIVVGGPSLSTVGALLDDDGLDWPQYGVLGALIVFLPLWRRERRKEQHQRESSDSAPTG